MVIIAPDRLAINAPARPSAPGNAIELSRYQASDGDKCMNARKISDKGTSLAICSSAEGNGGLRGASSIETRVVGNRGLWKGYTSMSSQGDISWKIYDHKGHEVKFTESYVVPRTFKQGWKGSVQKMAMNLASDSRGCERPILRRLAALIFKCVK